jgi:hypothetical protein
MHLTARPALFSAFLASLGVPAAVLSACSSTDTATPSAIRPDASTEGSGGEAGGEDGGTFTEKALTIDLALSVAAVAGDGGLAAVADAGHGAGAADGDASVDAGTSTETASEDVGSALVARLTITARDGTTPVITDLWLYTLDGTPNGAPLSGFTSTASRKSPRLMLPATVAGHPSGLAPADDGRTNGLMTNTTRGSTSQGAFVSTVSGTVVVTLPAVPSAPVLVVAAIEDQRYAGAAVINPDGTPGTVPAGIGVPETHVRRSFERDVVPILHDQCSICHNPKGPENANFYLVTGSRDELVNDNFTIAEGTLKCQTANPDGGTALDECVQAISSAEFLVEPGAPAVSDILQRARPDEQGGTSDAGLAWYGSKGNRYNVTYGDRRMPSTTYSTDAGDWTNQPTAFDMTPDPYQVLYDWVAQGAEP